VFFVFDGVAWTSLAFFSLASGQSLCLLKHCASPLVKCQRDVSCRKWMACDRRCGLDDIVCQTRCGDLHSNDLSDLLSQCMIGDWQCVAQRRETCTPPAPSAFANDFRLEMLTGHWFVTAGWNSLFDCFDCQSHFFSLDPHGRLHGLLRYRVKERLDCSGASCRYIPRAVNQSWVVNPTVPGHLENYNNSLLHYSDDWYVLSASPTHVLVYYCGCNDAWCSYKGSILYTRSPSLPPDVVRPVMRAMAMANIPNYTFDSMCRPSNTFAGCE